MPTRSLHAKSKFATFSLLAWSLAFSNLATASPLEVEHRQILEDSAISMGSKSMPLSYKEEEEVLNFHGQATYVTQQKNNFTSPYSGPNSLLNSSEGGGANSYTLSMTAFIGMRLWNGGEAYFNPEMFQGKPFGGQLIGLGGFQNGELQKGAFDNPTFYTARAFIRQSFNLGGEKQYIETGANQLAGAIQQNRVVVSYGKFATLDFFDQNTYSHDTRTQFQNFAIFSMGAYSYAADTKGYTYGVVIEDYQDDWIVKAARLSLPTVPNTQKLDFSLRKDYIDQIEVTHLHEFHGQPGALRALYYQQYAYMGSYENANAQGLQTPDLSTVRQAGQRTWGYGLNMEQAINKDIGIFARWSWNPGNVETQTVDISRSISGGVTIKGSNWSRASDTVGIGFAANGISNSQISYLQKGGISPFIGDGALNYKSEKIFETYYSSKIYKELLLTIDYQRISNPAFNASRGPVNFFGIRAHIEI